MYTFCKDNHSIVTCILIPGQKTYLHIFKVEHI